MQRIISLQTSRNADRASTEFVTKRLCCSFLFSVAFLSLLGGFLLGRYATERAILLKKVSMQQKQQVEESFSLEIMHNLTEVVHDINEGVEAAGANIPGADISKLYSKLNCTNRLLVDIATFDLNREHIALKTSKILNLHLNALRTCFMDVSEFLHDVQRLEKARNISTTPTILVND